MSDYCVPEKRKGRCDKRAKARYARYKKGGHFRGTGIIEAKGEDKK